MSNDGCDDAGRRRRAPAMSADDRRSAILDAAIPLLRERGLEVSTRELAEAADVAEGTLFRVFPDKDSIVRAAVERFFDPEPTAVRIRAIDVSLPTEEKVRAVLALLRARFEGIFGFMAALHGQHGQHGQHSQHSHPEGHRRPPRSGPLGPERTAVWVDLLGGVFAPGELAVPVPTAVAFLRAVASVWRFPGLPAVSDDDLVTLVCHGLLPRASAGAS